jgi:mannose-6-phosphate isomerase-like protein (cupin superfamily)
MKIGLMMKSDGSYEGLAQGLANRGHDVVAFRRSSPFSAKDYLDLAIFMRDAPGYDIIHNTMGYVPLLFSSFIATPILTTIDGCLTEDELTVYKTASQRCFFVATESAWVIPELKFLFILERGGDILDPYIKAYERVGKETATEDHRPWGYYRVLSDMDDHKVKRITVWPGRRLSLQSHTRRAEHWIIVSGHARVKLNEKDIDLQQHESVNIPRGAVHRIQNIGGTPLVFIEVQQGEYFGEDDITRLEDDFGRV